MIEQGIKSILDYTKDIHGLMKRIVKVIDPVGHTPDYREHSCGGCGYWLDKQAEMGNTRIKNCRLHNFSTYGKDDYPACPDYVKK